ncbi:MAG: hypothetical protein U0R80_15345 [Nocardioidaceae bacterium]
MIRTATVLAAGALALGPVAQATGAHAAGAADRVAPARTIKTNVPPGPPLVLKGHVSDGYAHKVVLIQKKNCRATRCGWHSVAKERTNDRARFRHRLAAPQHGSWFWRAKVKPSGGFGVSYSDVWRTFRE